MTTAASIASSGTFKGAELDEKLVNDSQGGSDSVISLLNKIEKTRSLAQLGGS